MKEVLNIKDWISQTENSVQFNVITRVGGKHIDSVLRLKDYICFGVGYNVLLNLKNANCNCKIIGFNDDNINVCLCLSRGGSNYYATREINDIELPN